MHMRKLIPALFALALLAIPAAGNAQISLGLRLGYAPALGEAAKDSDMSDGVKSQIPLQLDATYHLTPAFSLGGYASYGFGQTGEAFDQICDVADCSARVVRLGVQGIYSFNPIGQLRPFAGVGAGYEWGSLTAEAGDEEVTVSFRGFELLNLTAGADYVVGPQFAIGPYVGLSVGRYSNTSIDDGIEEISGEIDEKAMHQWLQFGIRGRFDL
jgi:outer membrane protein W